MTMDKKLANKVLTNLDRTAGMLEALAKDGKVDARVASKLIGDIDSFADRFQVAAFGEKALASHKAKVAKVIESDSDESYMKTFDNPNKVLEKDADESYMDTFDTDRTTTVTERDEYQVKDLSEHADGTKKQPSWTKGPKSHKASAPAKTWSK